ncbi:MAG: hypothetical protein KatS3mg101_0722 [Patescibacteria group bacterium]|nr:MAG: hypothetical protein KatS3mg101_0722 [Patescibacteria group bacterium]
MCKVNKQEKIRKICNLVFVLCCFMLVGSTVARIYFYNDLAVKNRDLKGVFDRQAELQEEIALLKYEDSMLSSIEYIESEAVKLGFVPLQERLISLDISSSGQVASLSR